MGRSPSKLETKLFPGLLRRPKDEEGLKLSEISQVLRAHPASFVVPNFQLHSAARVAIKQSVKATGPESKNCQEVLLIALLFCMCYLGTTRFFCLPATLVTFAIG